MNRYRLFVWMVILTSLAGLINAVSVFCYAGATVSHITGLLSKIAISASICDPENLFYAFSIVSAFFVGAVVAGIVTGERVFYLRKRYGCLILAIGILVLIPTFLKSKYSVLLLAFLMGLQNGMVVSFQGILVRMTHMTGNLTDFGVYVGYKIRKNKMEKPISGLVPAATIFGFTAGGIVGIWFYHMIGKYVFTVASAVYLLLGVIYFHFQKTCNDRNFNGIADDHEIKN